MGNAAAIDSATLHLTRLVGPLAGGALFGALGLTGVYLLSTALYAVALVNVATLERGARRPVATGRSWLHSLREGFAHVRGHRIIAGTLAVTVILNFFGFPFISMIPVIGEGRLHLGPAAIGVLMSMDGLGALVGASLIALVVRPALYIRIYAGGAAMLLATMPVFALSVHFPLSLGIMFVAGLGISGFAAMQSTILLSHTPSDRRPLLMGVLTLCIGAGAGRAVAPRSARGMARRSARGHDHCSRGACRTGAGGVRVAGAAGRSLGARVHVLACVPEWTTGSCSPSNGTRPTIDARAWPLSGRTTGRATWKIVDYH